MTDVLPGVWFGSLASGIEHISGLTAGSRLIPFCPLEKSSGISAAVPMPEGFWEVVILTKYADCAMCAYRQYCVFHIYHNVLKHHINNYVVL